MKGSWFTTIATGGIILVLTGFLAIQYNWLKQASDAEQEKMQRRLDTDAQNFANDINRELQMAYFNFQTESSIWERSDWTGFNERYKYWQENSKYPDLIKRFIFSKKGDETPLAYFPESGDFQPQADLKEQVAALQKKTTSESKPTFLNEDPLAFVLKVPKSPSNAEVIIVRRSVSFQTSDIEIEDDFGSLYIVLDKEVITKRLFPDMVAKHFPDKIFKISVKNSDEKDIYLSDGELSSVDASVGMLSLVPNNMLFISDRIASVPSVQGRQATPRVVRGQEVQTHTFSRTQIKKIGEESGSIKLEVKPNDANSTATATASGTATSVNVDGSKLRTSIVSATRSSNDNPWTMTVQHSSGSIATHIQSELNRKVLIGALLYLLAVAAIIAIVYSSLRARWLAQRQIDFVSSVSHEFRTPLAVLYSAGENLADGLAKDEHQVTKYGELIKSEGKRLNGMVEQILEFAGARSGKRKYNFNKIDVTEVVRSALDECLPMLKEQGFEVESDLENNAPGIDADSEAISGAVKNLITNAAKYSNGTRWIKVSVNSFDKVVKIVVTDHGIGIAKGEVKRIFEPFYRSKSVVDAQIRGNGLGLSMVKDVAIAHGGNVSASPNADKGSTFTISLPIEN